MATLGLIKIKIFWSKVFNIIISVHDVPAKFYPVTQIIL